MHDSHPDAHQDVFSKTLFGFWVYLMTDCVLFGTLFATYVVLHSNTAGGPSGHDIFSMPYALIETLILLTSSFTSGLAMMPQYHYDKKKLLFWFGITFLLGVSFVAMEVHEFIDLVNQGYSWHRSGFLTAFFTLVGTHGLHISLSLLWMLVLLIPVAFRGLDAISFKRLTCLRLFWHFLDVVWIFIFTIVYLMSQLQNSDTRQNRPFEAVCDPDSSPTHERLGSSPGLPSQTTSKSSIFPDIGVLQLAYMGGSNG